MHKEGEDKLSPIEDELLRRVVVLTPTETATPLRPVFGVIALDLTPSHVWPDESLVESLAAFK